MEDNKPCLTGRIETKALKRAVRRNIQRFPSDFMFEVTPQEQKKLKFQIGTSSLSENQEVTNLRYQNGTSSWGGIRYIDRIMCFS